MSPLNLLRKAVCSSIDSVALSAFTSMLLCTITLHDSKYYKYWSAPVKEGTELAMFSRVTVRAEGGECLMPVRPYLWTLGCFVSVKTNLVADHFVFWMTRPSENCSHRRQQSDEWIGTWILHGIHVHYKRVYWTIHTLTVKWWWWLWCS